MISKEILRMPIPKTPIQKTCEISVGSDSLRVDFYSANRQFDWLEISLVYDKSDKHLTIYDSYNVEHAAKKTKTVLLEKFSEAYSLTNEKKNTTPAIARKNIFCLNNLLLGVATALASRH